MTTADAAAALGVSQRRVQALIAAGRLPAQRLGRDWLIRADALDAVRVRRPGRPPGSRNETPTAVPSHQPANRPRAAGTAGGAANHC